MAFHVLVSMMRSEEHLFTEWALEGSMVLASMSLIVAVKMLLSRKGLTTLCTGVRLFSRMSHLMSPQMMTVVKKKKNNLQITTPKPDSYYQLLKYSFCRII